ncbi:UNVERIFIED_CONTAM: hypothetical protein RMT77_019440 [Armadillidium vulgare]
MLLHLSIPFVLFPFIFVQGQTSDPVKISVYYETLCPFSVEFFVQQLEPTYRKLKDIMVIESYPYGFAMETSRPSGNGYNFSCHHGPGECKGNKLLACGKKYIKDCTLYLEFNFCVMRTKRPSSSGVQCSKQVGISPDAILKCVYSAEGENLLHDIGQLQANLDMPFVPFILINDKYSKKNCDFARRDLKKLVCQTYKGKTPEECKRN